MSWDTHSHAPSRSLGCACQLGRVSWSSWVTSPAWVALLETLSLWSWGTLGSTAEEGKGVRDSREFTAVTGRWTELVLSQEHTLVRAQMLALGGSELPGVLGSRISMSWSQKNFRTRPMGSRRGAGSCCATQDWLTLLLR